LFHQGSEETAHLRFFKGARFPQQSAASLLALDKAREMLLGFHSGFYVTEAKDTGLSQLILAASQVLLL
jgi:hypothetical protein